MTPFFEQGRSEAKRLFTRQFGFAPPLSIPAPGVVKLLGDHTDSNEGLVLTLAVDRHLHLAAAPRRDGRVELVSSAFDGRESFSAHDLQRNPETAWADSIKSMLSLLRRRGVAFSGFSASVHATLPAGIGLGSSAALAVATVLLVRELTPFALTETGMRSAPNRDEQGRLPPLTARERLDLARLCQQAENAVSGIPGGLPGPLTVLFGKAFHALEIDCQSHSVEPVPMIGDIALVVCPCGPSAPKVDSHHRSIHTSCGSAARALGLRSLRSADLRMLATQASRLGERELACAQHVARENQRVIFGSRALREGDFATFGHYLFQSDESSRELAEDSSPERGVLVELARKHPACLGARLIRSGGGGSTINLVQRDGAKDFMAALARSYEERTGRKTEPLLCQPAEGALTGFSGNRPRRD